LKTSRACPADIAVGRLANAPSDLVANPAIVKDPVRNFEHGRSLCRLGFPFARLEGKYDTERNAFAIGGELSMFPLEGIYTRRILTRFNTPAGTPISWLETSSPGLKGHSGGPIFDIQGRVWGIQSSTTHVDLGFNAEVRDGPRRTVQHQFINLGRGLHAEALVSVLDELGVTFTRSED
jgi:hypothetical protein